MYLEYCSVFVRGTFCLLPYEPRVKLLNNGNEVGLRFGFERSLLRITGSRVRIPLEERFFPNIDGTSLHRAFHVRPSIVLIWLKYCWKGHKIPNSSIHQIWLRMFSKVQIQSIVCICLKRTLSYFVHSNILLNKRTSTNANRKLYILKVLYLH